jgi:hypothetical protein
MRERGRKEKGSPMYLHEIAVDGIVTLSIFQHDQKVYEI